MTLALSDPDPAETRSPSDHYERLFWLMRIADGDVTALAEDVVDRIRIAGEENLLLRMTSPDQRMVEGYLGTVASRRLAALPLDQLGYARRVGHPVDGAREAFEDGGEPTLAAAYYALVHDKLARSAGDGGLAGPRAALRFAVARALVRSKPESADACRDLVRRTLDAFTAADEVGEKLRADMSAWLEDDGESDADSPLSLVT